MPGFRMSGPVGLIETGGEDLSISGWSQEGFCRGPSKGKIPQTGGLLLGYPKPPSSFFRGLQRDLHPKGLNP